MESIEQHPHFIERNGCMYRFGDDVGNVFKMDLSKKGHYETEHQSKGYRQETKWFRDLYAKLILEQLDGDKIRLIGKNREKTEDWLVQYISYKAILEDRLQVHAAFTFFSGLGDWWEEHKDFFERIFDEIKQKYGITIWFEPGEYRMMPRFG